MQMLRITVALVGEYCVPVDRVARCSSVGIGRPIGSAVGVSEICFSYASVSGGVVCCGVSQYGCVSVWWQDCLCGGIGGVPNLPLVCIVMYCISTLAAVASVKC